jgi:hypothetical protein
VTFGTVTPATVTIFFDTGVARIPLEKLPPELQKRFGYDPQKYAQWQAAQQKEAAEAVEAKRKAAAAKTWSLTVREVLPNGIIARGSKVFERITPDGLHDYIVDPDQISIFLAGHPKRGALAEGNKLVVKACKDGVTIISGHTLEKWVYYGEPPP